MLLNFVHLAQSRETKGRFSLCLYMYIMYICIYVYIYHKHKTKARKACDENEHLCVGLSHFFPSLRYPFTFTPISSCSFFLLSHSIHRLHSQHTHKKKPQTHHLPRYHSDTHRHIQIHRQRQTQRQTQRQRQRHTDTQTHPKAQKPKRVVVCVYRGLRACD